VSNEEDVDLISISTGVNFDTLSVLELVKAKGFKVNYITIDIANGFCIKMQRRIEWIKENLPKSKIIAGNVMNLAGYEALCDWGADAVRVGIGQGMSCTTRLETGFGLPMFSCLKDICHNPKRPIIADGGIKRSGDVAKALVAGGCAVMVGSVFAACKDSPARIEHGKKIYHGSSSFDVKRTNSHIEGKAVELDIDNNTIMEKLEIMDEHLQSSISYAGGKDLSCFKTAEWRRV
jgi:GMP reductase